MPFFISQILTALLALASIRIYTEFLNPVALGQVMLVLSVLALMQSVLSSSVSQFVFYVASKNGSAAILGQFAKSIMALRVAAGAIVVTVVFFALLTTEMEKWGLLAAGGFVAACGLVFDIYRSALTVISNVEERNVVYSVLISADAILAFGTLCVILSIEPTISGFLLSFGLARGLSYLLTSTVISISVAPISSEVRLFAQDIIRGALPFSMMGILGWCTANLDRFVVASTGGIVNAGHYAVASSLVARPYGILTSALTVKYKPALFKEEASLSFRSSSPFRRWCGAAVLLGLAGIACFAMVAGTTAIQFVVGPIAPTVTSLLILFAVAFTLTTVTHPIENSYLSYGRSKYLLSIQLGYLPLSLCILGSFCFFWGATGAAWARVISEGLKLPVLLLLAPKNK